MSADQPTWTCPICGERAEQPAVHMRAAHIGGAKTEDRLGLKKALDKPKPTPRRAPRQRTVREPRDLPPAEPKVRVPEEGAILRMLCATPLERDTLDLRLALMDLAGVRAVGIDLASGHIDLEISGEVTVPNHVLNLAIGRCRLPVLGAELHERISGREPGDDSLIAVLR